MFLIGSENHFGASEIGYGFGDPLRISRVRPLSRLQIRIPAPSLSPVSLFFSPTADSASGRCRRRRAPPCLDSSAEAAGSGVNCGSSSKAICPICYEDLMPIVEDLQSVSLCGHVFHELCLQQWLEYCPVGKGCTCPVCKQSCTRAGVTRLYFQSTGFAELSQQADAQKSLSEAEAEALCGEISKLQGKLSAVGSALDAQKQHVEELDSEILVWKERARREEEMKDENRKDKELARRLLQIKEADLAKTSEECAKHQEMSLALAKELAALKLAMDVNLGEEEIAKLASLGHGNKHADAVDVLQKSLFLRNKSYKELMAQCNLLGRAETRSLQKLEKAEEKIKKLKKCLQELEKALEKKDSEILRHVKVPKGKRERKGDVDCFEQNADSPFSRGDPLEFQPRNCVRELTHSNQNNPSEKNLHLSSDPVLQSSAQTWIDVSLLKNRLLGPEASSSSQLIETYHRSNLGDLSFSSRECTAKDGTYNLDKIMNESMPYVINPASSKETTVDDDDFVMAPRDPVREQASVNGSNVCFGDPLLPTSLRGHENANRYAGKWCKRLQTKVATVQTSPASANLIAVGADGRGGRVKVLRPHEKLDGKAQSLWPKKCKYGATQGGQSRGCLRIEQFFGRMERV